METSVSSQVVCSYCEESVHRYASQCPYCQNDLTSAPKNSFDPNAQQNALFSPSKQQEKITQIPGHSFQNTLPVIEQDEVSSTEEGLEDDILPEAPSAFSVIFSLVPLLAGSFFFFFGALLKLFAKNGTFALSWNAEQWPYYVFPSLVLIVFGLSALSKNEQVEW